MIGTRLKYLGLLLLLLLPLAAQADSERELDSQVAVAPAVSKLAIQVDVGMMQVTPSPDDKVHVKVILKPKTHNVLWLFSWVSESAVHDLAQITLSQHQQVGVLSLALQFPEGLDHDDVKQQWEVEMPARLALKLNMDVGEIRVKGVAGGVNVQADIGDIILDVPRGALNAAVNIGEIRATSGTTQPGPISLSSSVGDTHLVSGIRDDTQRHGLGSSTVVQGKGPDSMKLETDIGDVRLELESSGLSL